MRVHTGIIGALFLLFASNAALADSSFTPKVDPRKEGLQWNGVPGEYRFVHHQMNSFTLDQDGTTSGIETFGEHRIRLAPELSYHPFYLKVELDVMGGQLYGDHEDFYPEGRRLDRRADTLGLGFDNFLLREAYVQYASNWVLVRVGQMASEYGVGILSNSGRTDDTRFGIRRYGDIVDRGLVVFTPFLGALGRTSALAPLGFLAAGDVVFRDENADFMDGDFAWMANAGIVYKHPLYENNIMFTYRNQEDDDGDTLEAYALNFNGKNRFVLERMTGKDGKPVPNLSFKLEYEAAWLFGHTDRLQQLGSKDGLDLQSFGAVGRLAFEMAKIGLEAEIEMGYASGDDNAYDDESHAFFFDPDYNVGLIFFDEMLPLITARAAEISSDPANLQTPPKGLDLIPSQGRVTNTVYYFPQIRYTLSPEVVWMEQFRAMFGTLMLFTPAELAHSYYTFKNGGVAANHLGRETDSAYIGTEFLLGLQGDFWLLPEYIGFTVKAQGGMLLPGDALADTQGNKPDPIYKGLLSLALTWY